MNETLRRTAMSDAAVETDTRTVMAIDCLVRAHAAEQ